MLNNIQGIICVDVCIMHYCIIKVKQYCITKAKIMHKCLIFKAIFFKIMPKYKQEAQKNPPFLRIAGEKIIFILFG